jgi:penicillin-binding protein 1A
VWMGYDQPRGLGGAESGGRLALPIWIDFMGVALKGTPVAPPPSPPAGLVREGDDWLYAEWAEGGWVSAISDQGGVEYARTFAGDLGKMFDSLGNWFRSGPRP